MSDNGGNEVGKFARWTSLRFNRTLIVQVMSNVDNVHGSLSHYTDRREVQRFPEEPSTNGGTSDTSSLSWICRPLVGRTARMT